MHHICYVCITVGLLAEALDKMRKKEEAVYLSEVGNRAGRRTSVLNKRHAIQMVWTSWFPALLTGRPQQTAVCWQNPAADQGTSPRQLAFQSVPWWIAGLAARPVLVLLLAPGGKSILLCYLNLTYTPVTHHIP